MYMKLKDGKSKVLTLSYDDGVAQDIRLIRIMDQYGIKGTFNINTGLYASEDILRTENTGRLKLSEALKLYKDSAHEVATHAVTHPWFTKLKSEKILMEVMEDRKNIEKQFGTLARGMAYPFGDYDERVQELLAVCGICYSRTVKATEGFGFPDNWLTWHPTCHHNHPKLMELAERFVGLTAQNPEDNWLFYLWGHSYEFDIDNNWNIIEDFCKYMGGHDDIWYATNIEIYDYMMAYDRLQVSTDGSLVHNPSAIDVWFAEAGNTYCIHGGQTLNFGHKKEE